MAEAVEVAQVTLTVAGATVRATVVDRISPIRYGEYLFNNAAAAVYAGTADQTPLTTLDIQRLLVNPRAGD